MIYVLLAAADHNRYDRIILNDTIETQLYFYTYDLFTYIRDIK